MSDIFRKMLDKQCCTCGVKCQTDNPSHIKNRGKHTRKRARTLMAKLARRRLNILIQKDIEIYNY